MTCTSPRLVNAISSPEYGMVVPCGRCLACRIRRVSEWSTRLECELDYYKDSCFVTLTYDDENIPDGGSLKKKHLQDFFKRLRFHLVNIKIRYFSVGEYGDETERPHYHCLIFGWYPDDVYIVGGDNKFRSSKIIDKLWTYGINHVGVVEPESIKYVCGYVMKKEFGRRGLQRYGERMAPFNLQSKGIGKCYAIDNKERILKDLTVKRKGQDRGLPRYFVKVLNIPSEVLLEKAALKGFNVQEYHKSLGRSINDLVAMYKEDRIQRAKNIKARLDLFNLRREL